MNKTVSIALAGFPFIIEEHAYIKLNDYLKALRNSLEPNEADEVMNDIEIRMVEIFNEILSKRKVINSNDVEEVINRIGKPEEIEEQEQTYYSEKDTHSQKYDRENKQLFRDPVRKKIAGVCAGLAHYIGLDITIMRVIWVILFLVMIPIPGSPLLIVGLYIILWIILPKAITATDFLRMKGEPINFDSLKKESTKIVDFANKSSKEVGKFYDKNKVVISNTSSSILNAIRFGLGVLFAFMAIGCIIGLFGLFSYFSITDEMSKIAFYFDDSLYLQWVPITLAITTVLLPALIFTFLAIKLLSPKTKLKYVGYVLGGLTLIWLITAGILASYIITHKTKYAGEKYETENLAINTTSDSLIIAKKNIDIPQHFKSYYNGVFSDKKTIYDRDNIDVDIVRKNIEKPYLIIKKSADGYTTPLRLNVPVSIIDNKIIFPNYINYPFEYRLRDYDVDYELVVPMNTIIINEDPSIYLDYDDDNDYYDDDVNANIRINVGGHQIEANTNDDDSIIIDGKKVSEREIKSILDNNIKVKDINDVSIKIKEGENEVSIETNNKK